MAGMSVAILRRDAEFLFAEYVQLVIMLMQVIFYETASGRRPVLEYVSSLPKEERAVLYEILVQIRQHGLQASHVRFRHIGDKLWELKVLRNRIFYVLVEGNQMVLLHAYKKQGQKLPRHERETAFKRMREVFQWLKK